MTFFLRKGAASSFNMTIDGPSGITHGFLIKATKAIISCKHHSGYPAGHVKVSMANGHRHPIRFIEYLTFLYKIVEQIFILLALQVKHLSRYLLILCFLVTGAYGYTSTSQKLHSLAVIPDKPAFTLASVYHDLALAFKLPASDIGKETYRLKATEVQEDDDDSDDDDDVTFGKKKLSSSYCLAVLPSTPTFEHHQRSYNKQRLAVCTDLSYCADRRYIAFRNLRI